MNKAENILRKLNEGEGRKVKSLPMRKVIERRKQWARSRRQFHHETPMDWDLLASKIMNGRIEAQLTKESTSTRKAKRILEMLNRRNRRNRILHELNQDNLDSVGPVQSGGKFLRELNEFQDMENDFFKKE